MFFARENQHFIKRIPEIIGEIIKWQLSYFIKNNKEQECKIIKGIIGNYHDI